VDLTLHETDLLHLQRCVELATRALEAGNEPFGSVLVGADGAVLAEDHNRESEGDPTLHPEFTLARWAALNLSPAERARASVYTSGEHCAMCAAAHAWCGLGPIVFATSTAQLWSWWAELGAPTAPVTPLSIPDVAPGVDVRGPFPELAGQIHGLLVRRFRDA
jgi:tRNA(Arg) A34 adenosine deaminase TadA